MTAVQVDKTLERIADARRKVYCTNSVYFLGVLWSPAVGSSESYQYADNSQKPTTYRYETSAKVK